MACGLIILTYFFAQSHTLTAAKRKFAVKNSHLHHQSFTLLTTSSLTQILPTFLSHFSKQRLNIACVKTLVLRIQIAFLSDHLSQVSILFQTSLKDKLLQSGDLSFKIVQIAS